MRHNDKIKYLSDVASTQATFFISFEAILDIQYVSRKQSSILQSKADFFQFMSNYSSDSKFVMTSQNGQKK